MKINRHILAGLLLFRAPGDGRPVLNHIKISDDGKEMVSADDFRLAIAPAHDAEPFAGKLLDGDALAFMLKIAPRNQTEFVLVPGEHSASVVVGFATVTIPYFDGVWPDYKKLVKQYPLPPKTRSECVALNCGFFADALKALTPIAKQGGGIIRIYPGQSEDAVWMIATFHEEARETLRLLIMPMFVTNEVP